MPKRRCIISFIDNKNNLILEMYYLYESFLETKLYENTDLILCGPKAISDLIPKHDSVIYLETESITENCKDSKYKVFENYHFINSISCICLNKDFLINKKYEYMLKTDSDVFLTPNFKNFFPNITEVYVGEGQYSNEKVKNKIKEIANREGFRYQDITNVGATWYGSTKLLIDIAEITMQATKMILEKDFIDSEGEWPNFFKGVSSMYGSEIAINHLVDKDKIIKTPKFDGHSDSSDLWLNTGVYHIHCWHTDNLYSKFKNIHGHYVNYDRNKLDYNKISDYCILLSLRHQDKLIKLINPTTTLNPVITTTTLKPVNDILEHYDYPLEHRYKPIKYRFLIKILLFLLLIDIIIFILI